VEQSRLRDAQIEHADIKPCGLSEKLFLLQEKLTLAFLVLGVFAHQNHRVFQGLLVNIEKLIALLMFNPVDHLRDEILQELLVVLVQFHQVDQLL
jgi:hypothetical protein